MTSMLDITLARIAIALVAVAIVANLGVSTALLRSARYSTPQKMAWLCIIWLLPLAGSLLAGVFLQAKRRIAPTAALALATAGDQTAVQHRTALHTARSPMRDAPAFCACAPGTC